MPAVMSVTLMPCLRRRLSSANTASFSASVIGEACMGDKTARLVSSARSKRCRPLRATSLTRRANSGIALTSIGPGSFAINLVPPRCYYMLGDVTRLAPLFGQHTDEVLHDWLGLSAEQVEAVRAAGALR